MINAVKMNLYQMRKMKSTYVFLIMILGFAFLTPAVLNGDSAGGVDPISFSSLLISIFSSGIIPLLVSIYTAIFSHQEFKTGFIKSISNPMINRGKLAVSKTIAMAVYIAVCFVGTIAIAYVSASMFINDIQFSDISSVAIYLPIEFLLYSSFCSVIVCITLLVKNSAFGMAIAILISSGIGTLLYQGIDTVIAKFAPKLTARGFTVTNYIPSCNIATVDPTGSYLRPIMVGVVFIIISAVIGYIVLNRRDVK